MQIRTQFNRVTLEHDGARIHCKPLMLEARLEIAALVQDMAENRGSFADLAPDSRRTFRTVLREHVIGWDGVTDERGGAVEFEPGLIDGLSPDQAIAIFWELFHAAYVSEEQRKNSSSPSPSAPAENDSTASVAEFEASIPAGRASPSSGDKAAAG